MRVLIDHLPRASAYKRALAGEHADWTIDTYVNALVADRLGILIWHNTEDGQNGRNPPARIPRPGDTETTTKAATPKRTPEELRAYLEQARARARQREGGE